MKITKKDVSGIQILQSDEISLKDFNNNNFMEELSIQVNINLENYFTHLESIKEFEGLNETDLIEEFTEFPLVPNIKQNNEKSKVFSVDICYVNKELQVCLNKGAKKEEILEDIDIIGELININEKARIKERREEIKEEKLAEKLIDIENDIRKQIINKIIEDYDNGTANLLLNSKNVPSFFNANDERHKEKSSFSYLSFNPIKNESSFLKKKTEVKDFIEKNMKENGLIDNYYIRSPEYKLNFAIILSEDGDNYLNKVMQEETDKYYRKNNLDPKTHDKKEKRKNKVRP